jgi:hypothetical protein
VDPDTNKLEKLKDIWNFGMIKTSCNRASNTAENKVLVKQSWGSLLALITF